MCVTELRRDTHHCTSTNYVRFSNRFFEEGLTKGGVCVDNEHEIALVRAETPKPRDTFPNTAGPPEVSVTPAHDFGKWKSLDHHGGPVGRAVINKDQEEIPECLPLKTLAECPGYGFFVVGRSDDEYSGLRRLHWGAYQKPSDRQWLSIQS